VGPCPDGKPPREKRGGPDAKENPRARQGPLGEPMISMLFRRTPPFSIVLFPLRPSVLFCGIGGILAVKKGPKPVSANARAAGPRGPTGPARAGMAHDGAAGAARCLINKCYRRWGSGR